VIIGVALGQLDKSRCIGRTVAGYWCTTISVCGALTGMGQAPDEADIRIGIVNLDIHQLAAGIGEDQDPLDRDDRFRLNTLELRVRVCVLKS
jgi:hypothetical protein